ncbi:sugar kinase [Tumidithrix elongata RA019]|uniref:Sugar kinase n=1 Tax=Tumidithrix elongata BACA0141 TaxID=2716417 RepID=A0AAW9PYG1_9CYAN|nr:sugar kinase [Tumidithrix elongata RA019]
MSRWGLFIGLVTLDTVYLVDRPPDANQKIVAKDHMVSVGGPATNAAVAFSYLGNYPTLATAIGSHPISNLIKEDLKLYDVAIADLAPTLTTPPSISSVNVIDGTGERSLVSINAVKQQVSAQDMPTYVLTDILPEMEIVLIDGHQMAVSLEVAKSAQTRRIPVVIDGGSWKVGFEQVLPFADYVICSANFYPPNCQSSLEAIGYLRDLGIPHIAITNGAEPIQYFSRSQDGEIQGEIPIAAIDAKDTLGAGDIMHGAFCHYILNELPELQAGESPFAKALTKAAAVASYSCKYFGARRWMQERGGFDLNS